LLGGRMYNLDSLMGVIPMLVFSLCWYDEKKVQSTKLRLPEDDADALKHVGVFMIYKILLIYIYILSIGWSG